MAFLCQVSIFSGRVVLADVLPTKDGRWKTNTVASSPICRGFVPPKPLWIRNSVNAQQRTRKVAGKPNKQSKISMEKYSLEFCQCSALSLSSSIYLGLFQLSRSPGLNWMWLYFQLYALCSLERRSHWKQQLGLGEVKPNLISS